MFLGTAPPDAALPGFEAPHLAEHAVIDERSDRVVSELEPPVAAQRPLGLLRRSARSGRDEHYIVAARKIDDALVVHDDESIRNEFHDRSSARRGLMVQEVRLAIFLRDFA